FVEGNEDPGERIAPRGVEIEQNAKPENGGNEGERHFLALLMAVAEKILDCGHHAVPGAAGMYGPGECPATTEAPIREKEIGTERDAAVIVVFVPELFRNSFRRIIGVPSSAWPADIVQECQRRPALLAAQFPDDAKFVIDGEPVMVAVDQPCVRRADLGQSLEAWLGDMGDTRCGRQPVQEGPGRGRVYRDEF